MDKLIVIILTLINLNLYAASLWNDENQNLFSNSTARRVGDIVLIRINEQSSISKTSKIEAKEEEDHSIETGKGFLKFIPLGSHKGTTKWKGDGKMNDSNSVSAYLSAVIVSKLPNGNLLVEGKKEIVINGEKQLLIIRGEVRPQDISSDNIVDSKYLANSQVIIKGSGSISSTQKKGLVSKILQFLL